MKCNRSGLEDDSTRYQECFPAARYRNRALQLYFFFFFGFFFTPPAGVPCADGTALDPVLGADGDTSTGIDGASGSDGRRFCIFCIRERFRASNRPRKMDENVLNLRHCAIFHDAIPGR